jgi:hypothetical protein
VEKIEFINNSFFYPPSPSSEKDCPYYLAISLNALLCITFGSPPKRIIKNYS